MSQCRNPGSGGDQIRDYVIRLSGSTAWTATRLLPARPRLGSARSVSSSFLSLLCSTPCPSWSASSLPLEYDRPQIHPLGQVRIAYPRLRCGSPNPCRTSIPSLHDGASQHSHSRGSSSTVCAPYQIDYSVSSILSSVLACPQVLSNTVPQPVCERRHVLERVRQTET